MRHAEALAEHGINDIDALANTTVDDLVEFLDLSLDEAEVILNAAQAVIALRNRNLEGEGEAGETEEQHAVSAEFDESIEAEDVEPNSEMTAEGYDEAVQNGVPYHAEPKILARDSADPVAVTEIEPLPADEISLMEPGRDLRPDTITPSPDITSSGVAALEAVEQVAAEVLAEEDLVSEADAGPEGLSAAGPEGFAVAPEAEPNTPAVSEDAASGGSTDEEKQ